MSKYFPPYRGYKPDIKVRLYLSNYATKSDLSDIVHLDT